MLENPAGIAADPNTGNVFVAELQNSRISEFSAWGQFIQAFGWGVDDGSPELQVCTASSSCQAGLPGSGVGEFKTPTGLTLDASGDVYVVDYANHRVQKFDSAGNFLLMFGGEVDKTTGADLCTAVDVAGGDVCGVGTVGNAPGEFGEWAILGSTIALGPSGDVLVGDKGRIDIFTTQGAFVEQIKFSEVSGLPQGTAKAVAVDSNGNVYLDFDQDYTLESPQTPDVYKLAAGSWELLRKITVDFPIAMEVDAGNNLYVVASVRDRPFHPDRNEALEFAPDGSCLLCEGAGLGLDEVGTNLRDIAVTTGCGPTNIFISYFFNAGEGNKSYFNIYGPPPDTILCPPPVRPPTILAQYAASVGSESALLGVEINPHYWADTTYYLEYGAGDCSTSTCQKKPLSPKLLTARTVNGPVLASPVQLEGLEPGGTYHYRFVAESSGGGPVIGPDRSFTTRALPEAPPDPDPCPNAALRSGASAALPDCRAYELVSPLQKGGGSILALANVFGSPAALNQSAAAGGLLTYSAVGAFAEPQAAPYASQYIATRGAGGWGNESISPPRNGPILGRGFTTDNEFKAFSADLCLTWLRHDSDPPLAPGAPEGFANLYRRERCAQGPYRALRTPAPNIPAPSYDPQLQGFSADGGHSVFTANAKLSPEAPPPSGRQLYESVGEEEPRFVCILPNGQPLSSACSAGTANPGGGLGRSDSVAHAISADGSRILWSPSGLGPGRIYARVGGSETLPVSAAAEAKSGSKGAQYWNATPSGSAVLFETGADLYTYDLEEEKTTLIAHQASGVMGASQDLTRVYFLSEAALAGAAVGGQPNLYLYEAGEGSPAYTFIGELSAADAAKITLQQIPSPVNGEPVKHTARVSPDGATLAFMATGSPTGYENLDRKSGEPDAEVYLYRAGGQLHCVSCDATGARPAGRELEIGGFTTGMWASAQLPPWQNQLYASRTLSDDGDRLFFESYQQLASADRDESQDVYEWEAPGTGGCVAGRGDYSATAGGCVSPISSGEGEAQFLDANADGKDAFFATGASLLPADYGLRDIYDARVEGGFPPPNGPARECEGAGCQSPPPTPPPPAPSSSSFHGPEGKAKGRCPKGGRLVRKGGSARCVAKGRGKKHKNSKPRRHRRRSAK